MQVAGVASPAVGAADSAKALLSTLCGRISSRLGAPNVLPGIPI